MAMVQQISYSLPSVILAEGTNSRKLPSFNNPKDIEKSIFIISEGKNCSYKIPAVRLF